MLDSKQLKRYSNDPVAFISDLDIPSARGVVRFGDVMDAAQLEWFQQVAPSLLAVAAGKEPPITKFWVERTKGYSKDSDVGCAILWLDCFSRRKKHILTGATDRDQAGEAKRAKDDVIDYNPLLTSRLESQTWTLKNKTTGTIDEVIACDPSGAHGSRADVTFINELSHIESEEFAATMMDNASKKAWGLTFIATNSGYDGTWQQRWRQIAQESPQWYFHALNRPAPWLSQQELQEAEKRNSKSRYRRLYWGDWPSELFDALEEHFITQAFIPDMQPGTLPQGWRAVCGCDLGVRHDYSAAVVLAVEPGKSGQIRVINHKIWRPTADQDVDLMEVERQLLDWDRQYGLEHIAYDSWGFHVLAQRLEVDSGHRRRDQQRMHNAEPWLKEIPPSTPNKRLMCSLVLECFREGRIACYELPELRNDLMKLRIVEKSYGMALESPRDDEGHGDCCSAFCVALIPAHELSGKLPYTCVVERWYQTLNGHATTRNAMAQFDQRKALYDQLANEQEHVNSPAEDLLDALQSGNLQILGPNPFR